MFNLDLNVKDPVDGLTITDWLEQELGKEDIIDIEIELFTKYQLFFREHGDKTRKEIIEGQ